MVCNVSRGRPCAVRAHKLESSLHVATAVQSHGKNGCCCASQDLHKHPILRERKIRQQHARKNPKVEKTQGRMSTCSDWGRTHVLA